MAHSVDSTTSDYAEQAFPHDRTFELKKVKIKNEFEHARRFCDCEAKLCIRGSAWFLQVERIKQKNPKKYALHFFLSTKSEFSPDDAKAHSVRVDLAETKDGNFDRVDRHVLRDGIELQLGDTRGIDPRDFRLLIIGKPADAKPPTPLTIMFSSGLLEDIPQDWMGDADIRSRLVQLADWRSQTKRELSQDVPTKIAGMSYYRMKDPAKLCFEMLGKTRFETVGFLDFVKLMKSMNVFMSEALFNVMFRFSDPEDGGEVDTLEMQFLLFLSTLMPKNSDVTLRDCFFQEDQRGNHHVERIDKVSGYLITRLFDDSVEEEAFRSVWDTEDASIPRKHTLSYEQFRRVFVKAVDIEPVLMQFGLEVTRKGRKKHRLQKNRDTLLQYLTSLDETRDEEIQVAYKDALAQRRQNRLNLDKKRWAKRAVEKKLKQQRRLEQAVEYRRRLAEEKKLAEEEEERKIVEKKLRKRRKRQLAKREASKKERHRKKVEWNKKIEAERVRELELDRLDLSGSDLAELPVSLYTGLEAQRNLGRLVLLDLSHNRIRTIHGRRMIYWMGSLQKLDCSNNEFTDLPTELAELSSIQVMNFSANRFQELADRVSKMSTLVKLDLSRNMLRKLPNSLGDMLSLRTLMLAHNKLEVLPPRLPHCTSITDLQVQHNELCRLPEDITQMQNLRGLHAQHNRLEYLPPQMGGLTSLRRLWLSNNRIHDIPASSGAWKSLEQVNLSRNLIRHLPDEMCKWHECMHLDVSRNHLRAVPKDLGKLKAMQDLTLHHNQIVALPPSIGRMKELQVLDASYNCISQIPYEIGALGNLRRVDLSHNKIGSSGKYQLPESMGTLFSLEWLSLDNNNLTDLCEPLSACVNLQYLNVGHNALTALPTYLNKLVNLSCLIACNNQLEEFPAALCTMNSIQTLDLAANRLRDLPYQLSELSHLRNFRVNANRLRALPLSFVALFDSFVSFDISHNPLSDLPNKFCFEKGPLKEHFGAHFIPKTKTQMVRQLLKEEDEEQLAVERARARRASAVQRVEIAAVTRGRRRSSLALAFAIPGSALQSGLAGTTQSGGVKSLESRKAERWMKPEDELRYAIKSISMDPHPPLRHQITHDPSTTHGYEVERRRELDESDKAVWSMWRGEEPHPAEHQHWPEAHSRGYSTTDAVSWMKVQHQFYNAARAEWSATGWQHHAGKNTLVNFQERVKQRMGDAWDEAIIPELQKFYFKSKHLGLLPEYEQLSQQRIGWRKMQEVLGSDLRTKRVNKAKESHAARQARFAKNYAVDRTKLAKIEVTNKQRKAIRDKEEQTQNLKQLRELMTVLDGRQRRIIKEVNKNKDFQHALNVWELQKHVMERSRYLNARAAENYVKPEPLDLRLISSVKGGRDFYGQR